MPNMSSNNELAFTRTQVERAVHNGADLVRDGLEVGDQDSDLIELVIHAALALLDDPGISDLEDAIRCSSEAGPAEMGDGETMKPVTIKASPSGRRWKRKSSTCC